MKIIGKSTLKFVMVVALGIALCLLSIIVSYYSLSHQPDAGSTMGHVGHTGSALAMMLAWFSLDFWSAILFFSSLLIFPFLYFVLANQAAVQTAIYQIWSNKLSDWVAPKVDQYLQKLEAKQPNWMKHTSDKALVKLKLLEANKTDNQTPQLQKKVISFLLKKVKLDDVDFQKDSITITSILSEKLVETLNEFAAPSNTFLWIVFGAHLLLFLIPLII
ncbi:hypothetical protein HMI54_011241 [Coelomomyces lativittatus]|nr:hypothetical protein HMI54_011241 [Coelomomyces lativittatus]